MIEQTKIFPGVVSVIIPIYNIEKYVSHCINSVIAQSYQKMEIILVDDGSTDGSAKLCDEFQSKHPEITVIHKPNGGLSDARNAGIDIAHGEFITFIDGDDYIAENFIEALMSIQAETNADIAAVGFDYVFIDTAYDTRPVPYADIKVYTQREIIHDMLLHRPLTNSAWGKLYRRSIFAQIRYPVGKVLEDLAVIFKVLLLADTIVFMNTPHYKYFIRDGSIMQSPYSLAKSVEIDFVEESMALVVEKYPDFLQASCARRLTTYFYALHKIQIDAHRDDFIDLQQALVKKIKGDQWIVLRNGDVPKGLKIRIIALMFGKRALALAESLFDRRMARRSGRRFSNQEKPVLW